MDTVCNPSLWFLALLALLLIILIAYLLLGKDASSTTVQYVWPERKEPERDDFLMFETIYAINLYVDRSAKVTYDDGATVPDGVYLVSSSLKKRATITVKNGRLVLT